MQLVPQQLVDGPMELKANKPAGRAKRASSRDQQRTMGDSCSPDQHRRHVQEIAAAQAALPA